VVAVGRGVAGRQRASVTRLGASWHRGDRGGGTASAARVVLPPLVGDGRGAHCYGVRGVGGRRRASVSRPGACQKRGDLGGGMAGSDGVQVRAARRLPASRRSWRQYSACGESTGAVGLAWPDVRRLGAGTAAGVVARRTERLIGRNPRLPACHPSLASVGLKSSFNEHFRSRPGHPLGHGFPKGGHLWVPHAGSRNPRPHREKPPRSQIARSRKGRHHRKEAVSSLRDEAQWASPFASQRSPGLFLAATYRASLRSAFLLPLRPLALVAAPVISFSLLA
jgi:hypothetical protein